MAEVLKTLYIVRHGQTDLNKQGIVQGRGMDTDLNDEGRKQAVQFFNAYGYLHFDKVYVSILKRTQQSVQSFIDKQIPFQKLAGLDELAWGIYEGKPVTTDTKAAFLHLMRDWTQGKLDVKFENGESPNEVKIRQEDALKTIMSHPDEKNVLICMHGRAMRLLLCLLTRQPLTKMESFPHQNLVLYKVTFDGEDFRIADFNNSVHLKYY